jgi:iron complex outermembrane receptor protein
MLKSVTIRATLLAFTSSLSIAAYAVADTPKQVDIAAGDLSGALIQLSKQYGVDLFYRPEQVHGLITHGAHGELTTEEAVSRLLEGTALKLSTDSTGAMVITLPTPTAPKSTSPSTGSPGNAVGTSQATDAEKGGEKKSFWDRFRVAEVDQAKTAVDGSVEKSDTASEGKSASSVEEIVVTANRREQSAQDVPAGLQVFRGAELDRLGANGLENYILTVPNVGFKDQGNGSVHVALRGVSDFGGDDGGLGAQTQSTVGLYLNDVAVSNTSYLPDLGLYDLNRIEVLKGPQGTLYGEGAMGGAIKLILNSPDPTAFSGKSDLTLSDTEHGGFNYRARAMANIPLITDKVALRAVGSYRDDSGFVDNVISGRREDNSGRAYSLRATLSAKLTDQFSAELLALYDYLHQNEFPEVNLAVGGLLSDSTENRFNRSKTSLFGLTLKYDLGFSELSSISSYYEADRNLIQRFELAQYVFGPLGTIDQQPYLTDTKLSSVAQELRLVSKSDGRLDWVAGAFYRHKRQDGFFDLFLSDEELTSVNAGAAEAGLPTLPSTTFALSSIEDAYNQYAVYGESNYKITDKLVFTAGLRWFDETVTYHNTLVGFGVAAGFNSAPPKQEIEDQGVVPKFGLSYRLSPDHLVYALATKGFRSSALNLNQAFGVGGAGATSDNIWNYEIGAKNAWADRHVTANVSAYYVDWSNMQSKESALSPVTHTLLEFTGNGGNSTISGVELELAAAPVDSIRIGFSAGYLDSKLTRSAIGVGAVVGAPLPNAPEWTGSGFAEYRLAVREVGKAYVRLDAKYTDRQATRLITATDDGGFLGSYTIGNARVGFDSSGWNAALFVDNVSDKRAQLGRGLLSLGAQNAQRVIVTRPRTIGISLTRIF